jgi:hypothetical protein
VTRVGQVVKLWRGDYADVGGVHIAVMPQSTEPVELWITWEDGAMIVAPSQPVELQGEPC